jgi:methylmalonyl-CoA epimerase
MELVHRETVESQGVEAVLLDVGEGHIELLAPLGPDTPVGKFLARKGGGIHHIAYSVEDIDAALEQAKSIGLKLIDESPRTGIRGSRVAFVHPAATGSVLTEIVVPVKLDDGQLKSLRKALKDGDSPHEVTSGDEILILDLNKVIFVRIDANESKVGF